MAVITYRSHITTDEFGRELNEHGTASFPVACYYTDAASQPVTPHWHNELEIILVIRGEMNVQVQMKHCLLQAGTGMFVNTNVLHAVSGFANNTRFHSLVFSPSLVGGRDQSVFWKNYLTPLLSNTSLPFLFLSSQNEWQKQFLDRAEDAWQQANEEQPGYEFRMRADLSECIFLLSENADHSEGSMDRGSFLKEQRLKTMLTYISTHYSEDISLSDIAASASVSATECMRCFREGIGMSPVQYLKNYRLLMASSYLKTTDWPVGEIGRRCGFQEMGYFAQQFKNQFKLTPTQYRKEKKD